MANTVTKTILANGSKSLMLHVYLESDGNEGELVNYPIFDPTKDLPDGDLNPKSRLSVRQVWHSFSWFDGLLKFDDLSPVPSWNFSRDGDNYSDFRYFGGIKERYIDPQNPDSSDRTGKLLLTTTDFAPLGSTGTMIIEIHRSTE